MKQHNQIGKYPKKELVLDGKKGRNFVTPKNKTYQFDYEKIGNSYNFIIIYMGKRMRMKESDFNKHNIDDILISIENSLAIN